MGRGSLILVCIAVYAFAKKGWEGIFIFFKYLACLPILLLYPPILFGIGCFCGIKMADAFHAGLAVRCFLWAIVVLSAGVLTVILSIDEEKHSNIFWVGINPYYHGMLLGVILAVGGIVGTLCSLYLALR